MPPSLPRILIIEDDESSRKLMRTLLKPLACEVLLAGSGAEGLALAQREAPVLAFMDLGLGDMHGLDLLGHLKQAVPAMQVIVLTGDTEVASAVKAMQLGALNYFNKPANAEQLLSAAKAALERRSLLGELEDLRGRLAGGQLSRLMGASPAVRALQEELRQAATTPFTVLIHGETGSGKEVVARALHEESPRAARPFVALDCGAIPEALLESELFGHERGAFTGAEQRREGYFRQAEGGSLFLDEIGNLSLGLQAKLLRVLQERRVQPLGGKKPLPVDVRVIAASHADLDAEVQAGRFRQDLYFRLAEIRLSVPPLRERREDLPGLAARFLEEAGMELKRPVRALTPGALALLQAQAWPGNVRELRNVLRQAALLGAGSTLQAEDLARLLPKPQGRGAGAAGSTVGLSLAELGRRGLAQAETAAIREALQQSGGNISAAVRRLKTDNKSLHVKLKKYGIRAKDYAPQ